MAQVKNIRKLPVTMELGGKTRTLKYDLNAFAELELRFGSVAKAMDELQKGGMKTVRTMLWAGLIHEEAVLDEDTGEPIKYNITPYAVGSWVEPSDMQVISEKIGEAIQNGLPEEDVKEKGTVITISNTENIETAKVVLTPEEEAQQKAEEAKNA